MVIERKVQTVLIKATMELMDIIKSSVSLFSGIMLGLVILSYIFYKFKEQGRAKPYERLLEDQKAADEKRIEELLIQKKMYQENLYRQEQLMIEQQRQQQLKYNSEMRRKNIPVNQNAFQREVMAENRFRVVNTPGMSPSSYTAPRIYELYSQNEKEQMHKLKLAAN